MTGAEATGPYGRHDGGKFSPVGLDQRIRPLADAANDAAADGRPGPVEPALTSCA